MTGELHTPAEAAKVLKVRESWLRAKATARAATPLETLLVADRATLLPGASDDLTLVLTLGYTGMRSPCRERLRGISQPWSIRIMLG